MCMQGKGTSILLLDSMVNLDIWLALLVKFEALLKQLAASILVPSNVNLVRAYNAIYVI